MFPGDLGELTEGFQFAELGCVVGVGDGAGAQAVAKAERDIVGFHDFADVFEVLVQEAFLVVSQAPFGHDRTTPGDDACGALGSHRHMVQADARMDGEVIHALLGLFDQGIPEDFPGQVLGHAADFFQGLVNRHGADGYRGVADDPFPGLVNVLAGRQVHDGIGAPADAPGQFLDFFLNGGADR